MARSASRSSEAVPARSSTRSRSRPTRSRRSSTYATTRRVILEIDANNHPIRHGAVVGIHNGIIENDDDVLARYGLERANAR